MKLTLNHKNIVYTVLVDDEHEELMNAYKWRIHISRGAFYVSRDGKKNDTKTVALHRQIMNAKKGEEVDHINHNGLDNRKSNLRVCTHKENSRNRRLQKNNTSGYTGVVWSKQKNKWMSLIKVDGKYKFLGYSLDVKEASKKYQEGAKKYFKEFANV